MKIRTHKHRADGIRTRNGPTEWRSVGWGGVRFYPILYRARDRIASRMDADLMGGAGFGTWLGMGTVTAWPKL